MYNIDKECQELIERMNRLQKEHPFIEGFINFSKDLSNLYVPIKYEALHNFKKEHRRRSLIIGDLVILKDINFLRNRHRTTTNKLTYSVIRDVNSNIEFGYKVRKFTTMELRYPKEFSYINVSIWSNVENDEFSSFKFSTKTFQEVLNTLNQKYNKPNEQERNIIHRVY
jgi:hypothetical protein